MIGAFVQLSGHKSVGWVLDGDGCWLWAGSRLRSGYGIVGIPKTRRTTTAHRYIYERIHGPIPPGLAIDHLCRNRACVNPDHLEMVTPAINARRGIQPKLNEAKVVAIRNRYAQGGITMLTLAKEYGVDTSSIARVVTGEYWKL